MSEPNDYDGNGPLICRWYAICGWYAICDRPAAGVTPHPILGNVLICQRCADKHELPVRPLPEGV